jgi:hypothetical protein
MKRIPMGHEARIKATERRRKLERVGKTAVFALVAVTAILWGYAFLVD